MANDDGAGSQHAKDMSRIHPPVRNLRVMRIDTPEDDLEVKPLKEPPHTVAEEATSWSEVIWWRIRTNRGVHIAKFTAYSMDLFRQDGVAQRSRRLVVHGMISKLMLATN